jgi:hypothetical protein
LSENASVPFCSLRRDSPTAGESQANVFETIAQDGLIRLPVNVPATAHCVVTVLDDDIEALSAQSRLQLPETQQRRMTELLAKNREGSLTPPESAELDALAAEFDAATLAKGGALAALAQLNGGAPRD